jgi:hypothetical protein
VSWDTFKYQVLKTDSYIRAQTSYPSPAVIATPAREMKQIDRALLGFAMRAVRDSYLLTAAAREEHALASPGQPHTAFTGALIDVLSCGDPGGPPRLTLESVYRRLRLRHRPVDLPWLGILAGAAAARGAQRRRGPVAAGS